MTEKEEGVSWWKGLWNGYVTFLGKLVSLLIIFKYKLRKTLVKGHGF